MIHYWVDQISWHELGFIKEANSCSHGWLVLTGLCLGNIRAWRYQYCMAETQCWTYVCNFFQLFFLSLKCHNHVDEVNILQKLQLCFVQTACCSVFVRKGSTYCIKCWKRLMQLKKSNSEARMSASLLFLQRCN